jgi:two-component system CheB/CheR fusion protein
MPPDSGMAFVIITHQAPDRISLLPELLRNHTTMPVHEVTSGVYVEPNTIYLPPPGIQLALMNGVLQPMPADVMHGILQFPVDYFFRSLADDQKEKATCIVLSGTGTDGALGVQAVKGAGGLVMVQEEQSAKFAGMPTSAIATGVVDYALSAGQMPNQLLSFVQGPYLQAPVAPTPIFGVTPDLLRQIYVLLRNRTKLDFSAYKTSTLQRRIERRMNVHQIQTADQYLRYLREHPYEPDLLFQELLIGVTNFFRDPEAFAFLANNVLPELLAAHPNDQPIRVWAPGCSTGEDAYSLAILLCEGLERAQKSCPVQIFATDLNPQAIEKARNGFYPGGIAVDVSPERLERFFLKEDGSYRIKKEIRELVVFAEQNILTDPPFTKLTLISCRNLLIYLNPDVQREIVPLFHYALNPGGILFLGSAETISGFSDLFATLDHRWKVFKRKESATTAPLRLEFPTRAGKAEGVALPLGGLNKASEATLVSLVDKTLVQQFAPPSVIVNDRGDIVYIHGLTGHFLQPAPGLPANNIYTMAREGLQMALLTAIREAVTQDHPVVQKEVQVRMNGGTASVDVRVQKIADPEALRGLVVVSFVEPKEPPRRRRRAKAGQMDASQEGRVAELEHETQTLRATLQSRIEEANTTNEELKSTNEELQSTNEELQSANEELETAKEEMQSLNEELQTVNSELQNKVEQLSRTNDDMQNLLNSTDIATLFLDNELCIKRFTPQTKQVFKMIPTDVGRPIGDLVSTLRYDQLETDAREVLRTLIFKELEVATQEGMWYSIRMLPYRTSDNVIDGLVMTFVDITKQRHTEQTRRTDARRYVEDIVDILREALVVLDADVRVVSANRVFARTFQLSQHEVVGQHLFELQGGVWDSPQLRRLLEEMLTQRTTIEDFAIELTLPNIGRKALVLNARRIEQTSELPMLVLLAIEERR